MISLLLIASLVVCNPPDLFAPFFHLRPPPSPRQTPHTPKAVERDPLILIPGLIGSVLDAKYTDCHNAPKLCLNTYDWHVLWLAITEASIQPDCFQFYLELDYNPEDNVYSNTKCVETRMRETNSGLDGIACLDPSNSLTCSKTGAYAPMIKWLTTTLKYTPGVDLWGAPYDWRLGLDAGNTSYLRLKALTEKVYKLTGKKVHYASISMGGPYMIYFFNNMVDQQWKDKYVNSFISMSGVMSGAPCALYAEITPMSYRSKLLKPMMIRSVVRSFGSVFWMVPPPSDYWKKQALVIGGKDIFTAADYDKIIGAISGDNSDRTQKIYEHMNNLTVWQLQAPNVPLHILYGVSPNNTGITYIYNTWPPLDNQPDDVLMVSGDNTVTLESLVDVPTKWKSEQKQPIDFTAFKGVDHANLLWEKDVWDYIEKIVTH